MSARSESAAAGASPFFSLPDRLLWTPPRPFSLIHMNKSSRIFQNRTRTNCLDESLMVKKKKILCSCARDCTRGILKSRRLTIIITERSIPSSDTLLRYSYIYFIQYFNIVLHFAYIFIVMYFVFSNILIVNTNLYVSLSGNRETLYGERPA